MKTLYLECNMGVAGDMLAASLLELSENPERIAETMRSFGLPGVCVTAEKLFRGGIAGTSFAVSVGGITEAEEEPHKHEKESDHEHHHEHKHAHTHASLSGIIAIIGTLPVSDKVKQDAAEIYKEIAAAESEVHGVPVSEIHFHEVGALDAIVDIVTCCLLFEDINADKIVVSPVAVGSGTVKTAHGILPVPAPATALILRGVPLKGSEIQSELCTPTGAAVIKHFVNEFGVMPTMTLTRTGVGFGKKEFPPFVNAVRAFLGETNEDKTQSVTELACNLDDMTGEVLGSVTKLLLSEGALDVWLTPILMKKGRPGQILSVLCEVAEEQKFTELLFRHTTTFGVRKTTHERYTLDRRFGIKATKYGGVRFKKGWGFGIEQSAPKQKPEFAEVEIIAKDNGKPVNDVLTEIQ